jgi:hypothetical protein
MKFLVGGRDTRDRAFEVRDAEGHPRTNPWFYPALPLLALGLGTVSGGLGMDFAVPLLGVLVCASLMAWAARRYGSWGASAGFVLWFGSPLLIWTLRGYFAEMAALSLILIGTLSSRVPGRRFGGSAASAWLMGLATAYHPLALAVAAPLLFLWLCGEEGGRRARIATAASFALGLLPLVLLTRYVCQPYGDFLRPAVWWERIRIDSAVRLATVFGAAGGLAVGAVTFLAEPLHRRLRETGGAVLRSRAGILLGIAAALIPLVLTLAGPWRHPFVQRGFHEFCLAVQGPLAGVLAAAVGIEPFRRGRAGERAFLLVVLLLTPLFFFLKGFDRMGMWSQRRLAPVLMLLGAALVPTLGAIGRALQAGAGRPPAWRRAAPLAWAIVLTAALLANPIRWPAPWHLRSERGVDRWIEETRSVIGGQFAVFDYEPFSSPFSVLPGERCYGVNDGAFEQWPKIIRWVSERAMAEPVWLVSAWSNPGLEEGVALRETRRVEADLPILRSRTALPAGAARRHITLHLLRWQPLAPGAVPPVLDKRFDGGPLALRGPWGRVRPALHPDGTCSPAQWTRQGSGVVGPIPPAGGRVKIEVWASSGRQSAAQQLHIAPPWEAPAAEMEFGGITEPRTLFISRPPDAANDGPPTGIYRCTSPAPYNPAMEGLRGYEADLGVLLHRMRISVASDSTDRSAASGLSDR